MKFREIYETGKKGLASIALVGTLAFSGCNDYNEGSKPNLPNFVVRRPEAVWSMDERERPVYIKNGVTYRPIVRFDTALPQLEGVVAEQGREKYLFLDGMYDGRLTQIKDVNRDEVPYGRMGKLPDSISEFTERVDEDPDVVYKLFRKELCSE